MNSLVIIPQDHPVATIAFDNAIEPQLIISDNGNQQLLVPAHTWRVPHGYVARWEITNVYDSDGDTSTFPTREVHLHKGTAKKCAIRALCSSSLSRRNTKRYRHLDSYTDAPTQGVDYKLCTTCAGLVGGAS